MSCTRKKLRGNNGKHCGLCGYPVDANGHCNIGSCANWYYKCPEHK